METMEDIEFQGERKHGNNVQSDATSINVSEPHQSLQVANFESEDGDGDGDSDGFDDKNDVPPSDVSPHSNGDNALGIENERNTASMEAMAGIEGGDESDGESDGESGTNEDCDATNNNNDISELIRLASAAAVRDATRMKRSDSELSISTGNEDNDILDELLEEDRLVRQEQEQHDSGAYSSSGEVPVQLSLSSKYMEQASYEASIVEDNGTSAEGTDMRHRRTQLKPSGSMGRMASRMSSLGIIDVDGIEELEGGVGDSVNDDGVETTNGATATIIDNEESKAESKLRGTLRPTEFETFHTLKSLSNLNVPKDASDSDDEDNKEEGDGNNPQRTRIHSPTTEPLSSIDLLIKCGMNTTKHKANNVDDTEGDQEILLLHALFDGFCRPPLEIDSVRQVVEFERHRSQKRNTQGNPEIVAEDQHEDEFSVDLPVGVVIQRPCDVLLNVLTSRYPSSSYSYLEKFPPIFVKSLFRILLRLLEGYTDSQYDSCVILASCPWQNEALTREQTQQKDKADTPQNQSSATATASTTTKTPSPFDEKMFVGTTNDATANANLMYSIVRLRMKWENPVKAVLLALTSILYDQQQHQRKEQYYYLLFPMIRLVGLLCVGGVAVDELRRMISIASDTKLPIRIKLLMTRALSVAASAAAPATITPRSLSSSLVVLGKSNPLNFFSFTSGPGITRAIHLDDQQQATWPFRNDFGAAFNFRVEDFSSPPSIEETSADGSNHLILLQAFSETGSGIEISLVPLQPHGEMTEEGDLSQQQSQQSTVAVLAIKTIENHKTIACIKVNNCPLHARVWYHIAVRHTRSRLKGVFSLSSREQLTVVLDGKPMLTEAMKFPQIKQDFSLKKTLSFHVGKNLDGQMGSIYIFRDNASDATFKALFEVTSSETTASTNAAKALGSKRGGEIVGQSHQTNEPMNISSRNIQWDDLEHIAFGQNGRPGLEESNVTRDIADLDKNEEKSQANNPLSKASFSSRLYISWNPRRKEKNFLMELQSGAHVSLDHEFVQAVCIENAQKVIGSIGGIQNLLSVFQSMLGDKNFETAKKKDILSNNGAAIYSLVPDLLILLSCFVRGNHQNARELLRCGGIGIVEQLLLENKIKSMSSATYKTYSIMPSLFVLPSLSKLLVEALLEFRSSCSHCIALEKEVFSVLLFNIPLWFEWRNRGCGVSLYRFLLPVLSNVVQDDPAKVRDYVGATTMISHIRDTIEMRSNDKEYESKSLFQRDSNEMNELTGLTSQERHCIINTLITWLFQIFIAGPTRDNISALIHLLSYYLEYEWNETAKDISDGNQNVERTLHREQRNLFLQKGCTLFYCSLELNPRRTIEHFAHVCGTLDGGVAWLLSALVNSYCDQIRSIGIRCVGAYMRATAHGPDLPLSFSPQNVSLLNTHKKMINGSGTLQENTISLISNVGQGLLHSGDRKENSTTGINARSKLTPRVIYKLLWHLSKSHRYRMGVYTQAALVGMVFEKENPFLSNGVLTKHFIVTDSSSPNPTKVDFDWVKSMMTNTSVGQNECIRDALSMNTLLRALRFLPREYSDHWLSCLVKLCSNNHRAISTIAECGDWQPCLFQFISEIIENVAPTMSSKDAKREELDSQEGDSHQPHPIKGSNKGFKLSLELYSILLGYIIRNNGKQSIAALEEAAALQRVYVNGQEVFALILSHIIANLFQLGVVPFELELKPEKDVGVGESNALLKYHAKMVTDAILSNGSRGMKLSIAMVCWRFLKYLTVSTTAFVTSFEPEEEFIVNAKKDGVTSGIFGILLPEGMVGAFEFESLLKIYAENSVHEKNTTFEPTAHKNLLKRLSVHIAAQLLSLLDVFIFPEDSSLDLKSSQLQGLALVRGTEKQIGTTQGPLLASLIRDSLLLLCRLEPSSVKMLQCCSRLRCFVHYSLELVRESDAMERYSVTFNKIALPFDRLLLSSFVRSHFALQKCTKLLHEIESDSTNPCPLYTSKEARKKSYRRIFRVTIELREILMTIYEKRNVVLRSSLTKEAIVAFQSCMEPPTSQDSKTSTDGSSQKEIVVRSLLASDWVRKFEMILSRKKDLVSLVNDIAFSILTDETSFTQDLCRDSSEIEKSFQKSLNLSFEEYLEKQRKWAETGAVRDLEFEGDTLLKTLSGMCKRDRKLLSKDLAELSVTANLRWRAIDKKIRHVWESPLHWKLSALTDHCGRRILLLPNSKFDSHESSRYDLMMGQDRDREEKERKERILQSELSDLMKRNSEALTSYDEILALEDDNDDERKIEGDTKEDHDGVLDTGNIESSSKLLSVESSVKDVAEEESVPEELNDGGDEWAKTFIWEDGESVVARFEEVMVVTLRYTFEGCLLLTTEGLYFHQIGDGIDVISKQPCGLQRSDRRWRLSGLKEVHGRRYVLRTQALELFFADGHELFLNFLRGQKDRNKFYAKLRNSCKVPMIFSPKSLNPRVVFKKTKITEMWRKRKISNFDYLMALNRMAGRTFNDMSQYPVFPWILKDYESEKIDLSDSRVYRDLSKPVGALNPDRLAMLIERYQELESFGFSPEEKFLYGSHYSSPGLILHFLIRQEPFTSMAIELQSGKFDCPDRLFFDLKESWKSCNTSSSDVKELIPELFTLPEMFQNSNQFPLGKTQRGIHVDNVGLPPWSKGSAHEFVRIHRLALESEYVSCNLQNWIDLVFGYKQRGLESEKSWNVFHFLSYEGSVDLDKMNDDVDRIATESHIQNFGQTPSQLILKNPHPSRYRLELSWKPLINNVATAVRLRCHTPAQQFGGKSGRGAGAVVHIHIKADAIIAIYSDLKVGFFWWSPKSPTNRLRPDRLQALPDRNLSYSRSVMKRGSAVPQTVGERTSPFAVGNWSFAITTGGYETEQLRRRNTVVHSRLASAKDALYTDASPLLVSCGYWDNTIKVHSTEPWKLESSDSGGHRGAIRCLAMGADGGMLVTGGEDCTCRIWVVDHPEMAAVLSDGYMQTALGRRPNENPVLTCCHVLVGHESAISCVALSSELGIVVSGSIGGKICIHKLLTGEFVRSFDPSKSKLAENRGISQDPVPVTKIVLEEHGRMVIQMGDYQLYTFTINAVCLCSVNAQEQIHDMKITGEVVVTGGENGHVYIRNLATLKVLSGMNLSKHGPIRCVNFTPEDLNPLPQFLFIGSDDGMISIVEQDS